MCRVEVVLKNEKTGIEIADEFWPEGPKEKVQEEIEEIRKEEYGENWQIIGQVFHNFAF